MRVIAIAFLMLAACPPKGGGGTGPVAQLGVGCPQSTNVYVASYLAPEEAGKGHTGWVLPLFDKPVESIAGAQEFATIDAVAAQAAGVPAPPQNVWLLVGGAQACKATIGGYYAAAIDSPTPNLAYGVELTGCQAPPDPANASAIVLVSESPPHECQLQPPRGVAMRLGEMDKQGVWARPAKETAIPPALAALVPKHDCNPPTCEALWSIGQVDVGGKPIAWGGAVNWLAIPAGADQTTQCDWKAERFSGFFVAGPDGTPVKVNEGQDHPLAMTAVLADKGGAKILVAEGPGEYSTYDLAGGKATLGRHLVWLLPHPDSYEATDHLGPVCGD
ncbi:MAG: hypothetical protein ABI867_03085 [Kofleriaceae bacterium]